MHLATGIMTEIVQDRLNAAVHECLDRCYQTQSVLAELAQFLVELKSEPGWRVGEIRAVELAVLGVLNGVRIAPGELKEARSKEPWTPPNQPR